MNASNDARLDDPSPDVVPPYWDGKITQWALDGIQMVGRAIHTFRGGANQWTTEDSVARRLFRHEVELNRWLRSARPNDAAQAQLGTRLIQILSAVRRAANATQAYMAAGITPDLVESAQALVSQMDHLLAHVPGANGELAPGATLRLRIIVSPVDVLRWRPTSNLPPDLRHHVVEAFHLLHQLLVEAEPSAAPTINLADSDSPR